MPIHDYGSSPLTRGKRTPHLLRLHQVGLIPAHAGKTVAADLLEDGEGAHPRSRGENLDATAAVEAVCGSSPLTRGKQAPFAVNGLDHGLIPAHAGKTGRSGYRAPDGWAHPRSRGEN